MNERVRFEVRFEGRVQGVGFRYTVLELAAGRPLTGYVRNEPDGSVRMVAEGAPGDLAEFLDAIADSRLSRYYRRRTLAQRAATGEFSTFEIRH